MSGLAALFHRDGRPADRATVASMLASAPYRGPDGRWVQLAGPVALGFAKLALTPEEETEVQPLVSPRTGCLLIAEARLDNRDELLARLPDRPLPTASDAELILRAYEAWGLEAPARLLGDFAFVLWDPRYQRLVCARDTAAQCGLFYRLDGSSFFAASEIQQLLQDPSVPVDPNEERIRDYLLPERILLHARDDAATFYAGVSALPAGHLLVVTGDQVAVQRYWQLEPPAELRYRRDEEYAEHYRALFDEVVRARLRTSRPIGALLSGGLDSASVVCAAQELYRAGRAPDHGFTSYSFVFDEPECDERSYIEAMRAKYGFAARYVPGQDFAGRPRLEPRGFQEVPDVSLFDARAEIFEDAGRTGTRVLLTGEVADAIVGSSSLVFDSLLRRRDLAALRRHLGAYRRRSGESLQRIVALDCLAPLLPLTLQRRLLAAVAGRQVDGYVDSLVPSWIAEPLRGSLRGEQRRRLLAAERERRFASPARHLEHRLLVPPEVSPQPAGWPVAIWRPFADRRLHEFLLAIPPDQKYEPHPESDELYAGSKWLVRRAMRGVVPDSILARTTKTRHWAVFEHEVARTWPVYEAAFGPDARPEIAARGYVDRDRFWSRLNALRGSERLSPLELAYVNRVVWLETWLRGLKQPRPELVTVRPVSAEEPLDATGREAAALGGSRSFVSPS